MLRLPRKWYGNDQTKAMIIWSNKFIELQQEIRRYTFHSSTYRYCARSAIQCFEGQLSIHNIQIWGFWLTLTILQDSTDSIKRDLWKANNNWYKIVKRSYCHGMRWERIRIIVPRLFAFNSHKYHLPIQLERSNLNPWTSVYPTTFLLKKMDFWSSYYQVYAQKENSKSIPTPPQLQTHIFIIIK